MVCLNNKEYECPSQIAIDLIDDKWKFLIIYSLAQKPLRISELSEKIPDVSQRTLSRKLKVLEEAQIIIRTVFPVAPPKVEYSLSKHGIQLLEVIGALEKWGLEYIKDIQS
ncbi:MAG: helix-turn-helix transcriptional regulator [Campylobacterales bacterium]|nr:helix-turn-helix transcriptional regulator [Campylobacterales bacterium]